MVDIRRIEVDRAFDETQSEDTCVEVQIPLGVACECGDVVNAVDH
jgi:hypothetical protein